MIIVVFGLPGSGKSYFASHLAATLKAEYINSDIVRKRMFHNRAYSVEEKLLVYDEMIRQMRDATRQQRNVVIDATFYKNDNRKKILYNAEDIDDVIFIEVRADESLIRERLRRARENSEADFEVYKKIKYEWEPLYEDHLILQSTDDNIKYMLEKTGDYLSLKHDKRTNQ